MNKVLNPTGVQGSLDRIETTASGKTVLNEVKHGWKISEVLFFQDIAEESLMGDTDLFSAGGGSIEYSRFNVGIRIIEDKISPRRIIPGKYGVWLLTFSIIMTILFASLVRDRNPKLKKYRSRSYGPDNMHHQDKILKIFPVLTPYAKSVWFVQAFFAALLLISAEVFVLDMLSEKLTASRFDIVVKTFDIFWCGLIAFFLTVAMRRFVYVPTEERTGQPIPQIVSVLVSLVIYVLAIMAVIGFVFDQKLTSLLATGGVLAMIIGLAVQVNISNIFSGIAMNLERPFQIDDWVKIGKFTEGKVIDISWRTTRLRTRDATILCIPNSEASESPIENFSRNEEKGYWKYFTIHVDPYHPPERVKQVLLNAALASKCVLKDPPPATRFLGLTSGMTGQSESWAANYLISTYVGDYGSKFAHNEEIWTKVWSHLKYAGIKHVMERQEISMAIQPMKKTKRQLSKARMLLEDMYVFEPFPSEQKDHLSEKMQIREFRPEQEVVRQGDSGNSLFIIEEGTLSVRVSMNGTDKEVARLGAGDFFGEMALLTGEPRTATVASLTSTHVYEITKDDIYPSLKGQEEIMELLSEVLSKRKVALMPTSSDEDLEAKQKNLADHILGGIVNFFGF